MSTKAVWTIRDREYRAATSTLTQLLSSAFQRLMMMMS